MKKIIIILSFFIIANTQAQENKIKAFSIIDVSAEMQVYPTGLIPGIRFDANLSKKDALNFRLAMNIFDHRDLPMKAGINNHTSETGFGYGFSLGYRHYFWNNVKNLFVGARSDLWVNKVDWQKTNNIKGVSNIIVIQPTIEAGWLFEIGKTKNFIVTPSIGFGYEWNALVNGEQTGYGMILLAGVSIGYRNK